jgi:hypothetical protein
VHRNSDGNSDDLISRVLRYGHSQKEPQIGAREHGFGSIQRIAQLADCCADISVGHMIRRMVRVRSWQSRLSLKEGLDLFPFTRLLDVERAEA